MTATLALGPGVDLPLEAVTETFAILAKRGSGKTYTAKVLVEEMLDAGLPVVVADPVGVWWGLRSSADGQSAGLPVVIFGGDHADVPLEETAGELLADLVVDERVPAVLDLSGLSKRASRRFMADFAERLYHRNRDPLHVVLDEADAFAPQRTAAEGARLLGAIEDLVRRGRARGIGVTLITQRPAVLNKDVLTQAEVLIALRMTGPRDVAAIDEWVRLHADEDQAAAVKASLPSLPVGTAWVWSPGWLGLLQRVAVRRARTFDSSATPAPGQVRPTPKRMADVDLAALGERIAATTERAKADDPKALRARVAELEHQLVVERDRPAQVERVEVPVLADDLVLRLEGVLGDLRKHGQQAVDVAQDMLDQLFRVRDAIRHTPSELPAGTAPATGRPGVAPPAPRAGKPAPTAAEGRGPGAPNAPAGSLPRAQRALLSVLAQHDDRPLTAQQVSLLSGYSVKSSSFANALGALRSAGLIVGGRESLEATPAGYAAAGDVPPMPTGRALVDHWTAQLGKAERTLLLELLDAWPAALSASTLSARTGYSATSSSFANALGRLRSLGLASGGRSGITAADELGEAHTGVGGTP